MAGQTKPKRPSGDTRENRVPQWPRRRRKRRYNGNPKDTLEFEGPQWDALRGDVEHASEGE